MAQSPLFSILRRELAERARHWTTFAMRAGVGLFSILAAMQQLLASGPVSTPGALGRAVLGTLLGAAFLLACGAGVLCGNALLRERREGTVSLVLLTEVTPLELLLGKAVSAGLTTLCASLAFLPGMLLPVLAGGVGAGEAAREAGALICTIWFAIGAGICGAVMQSTRARSTHGPALACAILILAPAGMKAGWFGNLLSPLVLLMAASEGVYSRSPRSFWLSFCLVQAMGWLFLVVAAAFLRRNTSRDEGSPRRIPARQKAEEGRAIGMGRWRPHKEDSEPMEWVVYRDGIGVAAWFLGVLSLVVSRWVALLAQSTPWGVMSGVWLVSWPLGLASALVGGWVIAGVASGFFARARERGELELLLVTPVGARTFLSDQWRVQQRIFLWPVLLMQLALLLPVSALLGGGGRETGWLLLRFGLSMVNTGLGVAALCWVGMHFALKGRSYTTAVWWAIALSQGVPWLVTLVFGTVPIIPEVLVMVYNGVLLSLTTTALVRGLQPDATRGLRMFPDMGQGGEAAGNVISST